MQVFWCIITRKCRRAKLYRLFRKIGQITGDYRLIDDDPDAVQVVRRFCHPERPNRNFDFLHAFKL